MAEIGFIPFFADMFFRTAFLAKENFPPRRTSLTRANFVIIATETKNFASVLGDLIPKTTEVRLIAVRQTTDIRAEIAVTDAIIAVRDFVRTLRPTKDNKLLS